jgi:N4-gp56 family major capsid protein
VLSALTEGTSPTEQSAPSITQITATPLFYGAWIGYTDEIDYTIYDPMVSEVSGILGEQAGVSADTLIRNALTDGATKDYSGAATSRVTLDAPGHDVTYADFVKQVAALEAGNALPLEGDNFVCIMHPHTWATLMQDPTFVNLFTEEAPNSALRSGMVGRLLRCNIYVSANAREYADGGVGGTTDVYSMLFLARESYGVTGIAGITPDNVDNQGVGYANMTGAGRRAAPVELIVKGIGSAGADDPLNQRGTIGWKMALDVDVLNSAWLLDLEHTNAFSDD